jgi:AmmeMemoRadiSam system protein A
MTEPAPLTADEKRFLLDLARRAVAAAAAGDPAPDARALAAEALGAVTPALALRRGAFVTLTADGRLRGCIGYIEGIKPLLEAVLDNARSAAIDDPRFDPVRTGELNRIHLEISALTPLHEVAGPQDIEIGRHGILLARGRARAVFLPQVAPEQGWDLETTLDHLSMKAGLGPGSWREEATFQVFEAEVFEEETPGG